VDWKMFLLCLSLSITVLWIIDSIAPPKTKEKLHGAAITVFKWLVYIFVIGGVIGLLNLGWEHLMK
jgi:hypothetical protein